MVQPDHVDAGDRGFGVVGRSRHRRWPSVAILLVAVGALAGASCTRPEDAASADVSIAAVTGTSSPDDAVPTSEPVGDTSERAPVATTSTPRPSTTTTAETATSSTVDVAPRPTTTTSTTTPPPPPDQPSDLTLLFDGILPFRFGDRDVDVVPALTELLGPPTRDELREYPVAEQGIFVDANGEESFVARFGRTVCYADGLCVQFGAGAPETLIFTGWRVDDASSALTTEDGLSVGSTLDEFDDLITFDPALACAQQIDGSAAGIDVTLLSDGDDFATSLPDPADVTVIEMRAGQLPTPTRTDC